MKLKNSSKGITLIALVITIIVLLILAGVTIATLTGENGIINQATNAKVTTKKGEAEETVKLILNEWQTQKYTDKKDLKAFLESKVSNGNIDSMVDNGNGTVTVKYGEYSYIIDEETLEMTLDSGVSPTFDIQIGEVSNGSVTITVTVTNAGELGSINSIKLINVNTYKEITGIVAGSTGTFTVSKNGDYKVSVTATKDGATKTATKTTEVNTIPVTFATTYGRVEVIWIDEDNNPISKPLPPELYNGKMTPVKWTGTAESETTPSDSSWYNYKEIKGTGDNTTSLWANAKNEDESYFVWIPRYAYRITYYENETDDANITGYYDGRGMVDVKGTAVTTVNGATIGELESGIQKVTKDGKSYIVHPAFETDIELGGWDKDLSGIWVAKYEMSRTGASTTSSGSGITFLSVPNVQSAVSITIGNMYTYARDYDADKLSHFIKNSEWGAVAFLTHSQYGRNGHEISVNQCSDQITGVGRGLNNKEDSNKTGTSTICNSRYTIADITDTQKYNGEVGMLSSSTGNITGIYDLSGGTMERVAAFNDTDTNNYESTNGSSFAAKTNPSTKWVTKYSNSGSSFGNSTTIYATSKTGDAIKETRASSDSKGWFNDYSNVLYESKPFFYRGGDENDTNSGAGVFFSSNSTGSAGSSVTFRIVLAK